MRPMASHRAWRRRRRSSRGEEGRMWYGCCALLCSVNDGESVVCRAGCWKGYTGFRFSFDSLPFSLPPSLAPAFHSRFGRQTKQLTSSFCAYTFPPPLLDVFTLLGVARFWGFSFVCCSIELKFDCLNYVFMHKLMAGSRRSRPINKTVNF